MLISIDVSIYNGLLRVVGRGKISRFIEDLVRPYVSEEALDAAYREMAADKEHETEAREWSEALIGDIPHETW